MKGGEKLKWTSRIKMAVRGAAAGWKGQGFDFRNWFGRKFWGIDNGQLATNETIFSVISRKANTLSSLPIKLYQNYDIMNNDLSDLITNNPNPNMTSYEFFNKLEVSRNETGNGYAIISRDIRMQPDKLLPIDSSYVTPFLNQDDGELWYKVLGDNGTYYFHNMNMLHVKHITGASRLEGINPIKVLDNTIKYDKAVQEFSLSEMEKKESFILTYATNVGKEKREEIVADFRRFYSENGGVLFQEHGVTIDQLEKKYFASDTLASEKITRSRVANVFNVPITFLNEDGGGFSNNEQTMIQYVQMGLTSDIRQYEQEMNRKLITKDQRNKGSYWKFNLGGLLRGDTAARTAFYQMAVRCSIMKPDEVRELEDLPPEGGNASKLWVSGDLYPIEMDPTLRKTSSKGGSIDE